MGGRRRLGLPGFPYLHQAAFRKSEYIAARPQSARIDQFRNVGEGKAARQAAVDEQQPIEMLPVKGSIAGATSHAARWRQQSAIEVRPHFFDCHASGPSQLADGKCLSHRLVIR